MRSAYEHPEVVEKYLEREVKLHRMFPLTLEEVKAEPLFQISPYGLIPKRGQAGKWRLIVDLSSPPELSVNAGVASAPSCTPQWARQLNSSNTWATGRFWQRWTSRRPTAPSQFTQLIALSSQ